MTDLECPINRHVFRYRVRYADLNERLFHAVKADDHYTIRLLIRAGAVVDPKYRYGISLLPGTPLFVNLAT